MAKRKWNWNAVYISERLQECLRPISRCALTTVVAPMGYGKTTAVNWYLAERKKAELCRIVRISVYSDNLAILWKSVQDAFAHAGLSFLQDYACPEDAAGASLLTDDLCHALSGEQAVYLFLDDFHLLTDARVPRFLAELAVRLPEQVHLIVASRDRFLAGGDVIRLGGRLYRIGTEQLRLNHTELAVYARRCGTELSDAQIDSLLYSSEGWFSAIYLNLRTLSERGSLPSETSDIYAMFTEALIEPLPAEQQEFLAVMGLVDEFTIEMAEFITERTDTKERLAALTGQNAFVSCLPDGRTYRFHHMMKDCAARAFSALPAEKQTGYLDRCGTWYARRGQYLHAFRFYRSSGNFDALLHTVALDAGILLASVRPDTVLATLALCPKATLCAHPLAILVLMRSMFNWHRIPEMMQLKELLLAAIAQHPELSDAERGNLRGECDLILSFLCYNDISAMSRLHRSASAQMTRPAISIQSSGGWTFGSPSILMMFHREPGMLPRELEEMDACMPHYYRITNGHGQGAETLMHAEVEFQQGHFDDAQIALERAYAEIEGNGQQNIVLCCDFLADRLFLAAGIRPQVSAEVRRTALLRQHNAAWLNLWDAIRAYDRALLGDEAGVPALFREHRLASVNFLAPGRPMMDLIENQVYLLQGAWAKVIARSEGMLAACQALHYGLVALHLRLQTAAAYVQLEKWNEAGGLLRQAVSDAEPDGLLMPFVENYRYLAPLIPRLPERPFLTRAAALGEQYEASRTQILEKSACPAAFAALTERERAIAELVAARLSNREIAERLFLSEGSVKQYINQIYAKLLIEGDNRTKRQRLAALKNS